MWLLLEVFLVLIALAAIYAAWAYSTYTRILPAERGCVGCAAPVTVGDYALYYRAVGTDRGRPPVVLVHGGPGHSSLSFKNSLDFLAAQTRVIYYDQRGSGRSQVKPRPQDYTVEQLVEELEALRRDIVGAEKIILVGHSFGGAVAQRYALRYPEHVAKLVLIASVRINNGLSSRWFWKWLGPALYTTALGWPPAEAGAADAWFTQVSARDEHKRLFDPAQAHLLRDSGPLSFAPWREISRSVAGYDFKAELRRLDVPTLFIYGAADAPYTGKPVADALAALLPNCASAAFQRSGHWPFLEEPELFQRVLRAFLANELAGE